MSAQEILIEEIKRQREEVASMESLVADTWEKLGPAPEMDYDRL